MGDDHGGGGVDGGGGSDGSCAGGCEGSRRPPLVCTVS